MVALDPGDIRVLATWVAGEEMVNEAPVSAIR